MEVPISSISGESDSSAALLLASLESTRQSIINLEHANNALIDNATTRTTTSLKLLLDINSQHRLLDVLEKKQAETRQLSENGKRLSTENKIALERLREVERENDDLKSVLEELRSDKRALDDSVRGNSGDNEKILILEANILDLRDSLDRTKQECAELLSSRKELEQERQKSISLQKVALYIL